MYQGLRIGAVIPARDEEAAIAEVVLTLRALRDAGKTALIDEVVVADNGSKDATAARARAGGARVVQEPSRGYGRACQAALPALNHPDIILFVDGDRSVIAAEATRLLHALANGADLAVGSRTLGRAERGALTRPQRCGNGLAAFLIRRLWRHPCTDLGPFRAIRREALEALAMADPTFGWTVEMQVKAIQRGYEVVEVPVTTRVRVGRSKVSGTLSGVVGAGIGILSMIARLWWQERSPAIARAVRRA
ncbi:MAG: glycosyltransferase family 2 protein [Chromatiales bacterium]